MSQINTSIKCVTTAPKRVLHFSDGVLEESEEEENADQINENQSEKAIVLNSWPIISVVANSMVWLGSQTLKVCDYLGENLAQFFGITSPKYEFEIEEYNRRIEEQKKRQTMLDSEFEGWTQSDTNRLAINLNDIKSCISGPQEDPIYTNI